MFEILKGARFFQGGITPAWILFALLTLWAAAQFVYLAYVSSFKGLPSSSELLYHQGRSMQSGIWLTLGVVGVFGLESIFLIWGHIGLLRDPVAKVVMRADYSLVHLFGWLFLLILLLIGYAYSGWTVSIDTASQTIMTRSNHLFPPGMTQNSLGFSGIQYIKGDFEYLPKLHYVLKAETTGGKEMELGRDPLFPSEELLGLGRTIADKSGAKLDLR